MSTVEMAIKVVGKVVPAIFPVGQIVKVASSGYKITNSTNPLVIGANITLTVIDCCAPPPARLAVSCLTLATVATSALMAPNPVSFGATIHFMGKVYDECL